MGYQDPGVGSNNGDAATHAWAEALVPGAGWIGFDATHDLLANDRYVPVAVGRDSYDAAPQRGSYKGGDPGSQPRVRLTMVEKDQGLSQNQGQSQSQNKQSKTTKNQRQQ
jgi:transglutaminase-like putative cysteine protease